MISDGEPTGLGGYNVQAAVDTNHRRVAHQLSGTVSDRVTDDMASPAPTAGDGDSTAASQAPPSLLKEPRNSDVCERPADS